MSDDLTNDDLRVLGTERVAEERVRQIRADRHARHLVNYTAALIIAAMTVFLAVYLFFGPEAQQSWAQNLLSAIVGAAVSAFWKTPSK